MINVPLEVRKLFENDSVKKNFRCHFIHGEDDDIVNDRIVADSVSFTESLCSRDSLKYGLCEASTIDFTAKNVGNIKECLIDCSIEIDCSSLGETWCSANAIYSDDVQFPFYRINYGKFIVQSCNLNEDGSRKVIGQSQTNELASSEEIKSYKLEEVQGSELEEKYDPYVSRFMYINTSANGKRENNLTYVEQSTTISGDSFVDDNSDYFNFSSGSTSETIPKIYDKNGKRIYYVEIRYAYLNLPSNSKNVYQVDCGDVPRETYKNVVQYMKDAYEYSKAMGYYVPYEALLKIEEIENCVVYPHGYFSSDTQKSKGNKFYFKKGNAFSTYISSKATTTRTNSIKVPVEARISVSGYGELVYPIRTDYHVYLVNGFEDTDKISIKKYQQVTTAPRPDLFSLDTNRLIESYYELQAKFGTYDRGSQTYKAKALNTDGLYPRLNLFPKTNLYPKYGNNVLLQSTLVKNMEIAESNFYGYRMLIIKVKVEVHQWDGSIVGTDMYVANSISAQEAENVKDNQKFYISDNYVLLNTKLWDSATARNLCNSVFELIKDVSYQPLKISIMGLPFIELGDGLVITNGKETYRSIVLRRTLSGVQHLNDFIESR